MADLGDLLGSLMCGVIRARRVADEQTAALAEYYKSNPLLEGLSVPRIRIPELTIEMPMLIEDQVNGETGEMADPDKIAAAADAQLKTTMAAHNIRINPAFHATFATEVRSRLELIKQSATPVMNETVARTVQAAFAATVSRMKTSLNSTHKEAIAKALRAGLVTASIAKEPVAASIGANIRTADVKEQSSSTSVVRLKITLKEEGLEWGIQANDSGGVTHTLQPE